MTIGETTDGGAGTTSDAAAPLDGGALRRALAAARHHADATLEEFTSQQERRARFAAGASSTCVPKDTVDLKVSAESGTGHAYQWSLDLAWRHRLTARLATEWEVGRIVSTKGVFANDTMTWDSGVWKTGVHLRHGRGSWGDFYWGPELAFAKKEGAWDLLAVDAQVGYSLAPERERGNSLGTDFRLFLEPWFPTDGRGTVTLFGFAAGFSGICGERNNEKHK